VKLARIRSAQGKVKRKTIKMAATRGAKENV
jgi:hypothetical protein